MQSRGMKTFALSLMIGLAPVALEFAAAQSGELPPPVSEKIYTFAQIEKEKASLKDKVVKIEILRLLGEPSDLLGNRTLRYIAKDTSHSSTPYGQVAFTREGLERMGLAGSPHREGPYTVYALVHVFRQKQAAPISIVLGNRLVTEDGKTGYGWGDSASSR